MATSKLYKLSKEIEKYESKISEFMAKKDTAKKELEELLKANFGSLKNFIAEELYKELGDADKKKIDMRKYKEQKRREQLELMKEIGFDHDLSDFNNATSWDCDGSFDPYVDEFEILDVRLSEDKSKAKIKVECIKNRQYLGITGCWIPSTYTTGWIAVTDLVKEEQEKSLLNI